MLLLALATVSLAVAVVMVHVSTAVMRVVSDICCRSIRMFAVAMARAAPGEIQEGNRNERERTHTEAGRHEAHHHRHSEDDQRVAGAGVFNTHGC